MSRSKKRFSDRSPAEQSLLALTIVAALGVVATAERDLQHRPSDQIRGSKLLWRVVCLNALGAGVYFRWGRLRPKDSE